MGAEFDTSMQTKVFISWSGEQSKHIATALRELLPDLLQGLDPWMSEHDIAAGSRWLSELITQLSESQLGIICLTPENLQASSWLLFEAGALAKSIVESRVISYRLGVSSTDVAFPLAQFQGVDANKAGTQKLVRTLNLACDAPIPEERLERMFARWWPDFSARLNSAPASKGSPAKKRDDRSLLEEILQLVRRLQPPQSGSIEDEIARLRSDLGPVSPKTEKLLREQVRQALARMTIHDMGRESESGPLEAVTIYLEVEGDHKELKNGMPILYDYSGVDFISDLARMTHLNPEEFGKGWRFKDERDGHVLTEEEGKNPRAYFQSREPRMILEIL